MFVDADQLPGASSSLLCEKSGAASVVASLWLINDESTATLISEFYQQLRNGNGNKAKALQNAQLVLMQDERYAHPNYWAPFLLVGNWL